MVESRGGAATLGRAYLLPPLSSGGALVVLPWLRFHTPLIEPDMQISRIRLSDKTSRLHPRQVRSFSLRPMPCGATTRQPVARMSGPWRLPHGETGADVSALCCGILAS